MIYMVPTPRGVEISKTFSLPFNKDKTLIGPLEVLTESDKEIVVLISSELSPKKKIAMRLNKDNFDAVQSHPLN